MHKVFIGLSLIGLMGCATTSAPVMQAAIPEVGWTRPTPEPVMAAEVSTPIVEDRPPSPYERVYAFTPGVAYEARVAVGTGLDLWFQPGELIRDKGMGDRSVLPPTDEQPPWDIREGSSGNPERPHIFVTVTKPGLTTGLHVTTSKRVYAITLKSVASSKVRFVRWTYPDEAAAPIRTVRLLPDPDLPRRYYGGYTMETSTPTPIWTPTQVLNDGRTTYLLFPHAKLAVDAPMFRMIGSNGPELANVRDLGRVYVIDHLTHRIELRLGVGATAEVVTIQRNTPEPVDCPGDPKCPVWPPDTHVMVKP